MKNKQLVESLSGVRGVYGAGLDEHLARSYAHAFAQHIRTTVAAGGSFVVGGDARSSTRALMDVFADVFVQYGFSVYDVGITSTPVTEFAVRQYQTDGGVMITASHNPPEYNGWKMLAHDGAVLDVATSQAVIDAVHAGVTPIASSESGGAVSDVSQAVIVEYCEDIKRIIGHDNLDAIKDMGLKVVVDPNGSGVARVIDVLFPQLGIEYVGMNTTVGTFVRTIEPTVETLKDVVQVVDDSGAQFGCGFDADADRVEIVLPSTTAYAKQYSPMVSGNYVLALGVESVLSHEQSTTPVVVNIATSHLIHGLAQQYTASVVAVDVGETNVVSAMQSLGSRIGGEGSNGGIIEGSTRCRDGIVSIVLIARLLAATGTTLAEKIAEYPVFYDKRTKVGCTPEQAAMLPEKLMNHFTQAGATIEAPPSTVGGIKVLFDETSFVMFRASATEPGQFRIIANSDDEARATELLERGSEIFEQLTA